MYYKFNKSQRGKDEISLHGVTLFQSTQFKYFSSMIQNDEECDEVANHEIKV